MAENVKAVSLVDSIVYYEDGVMREFEGHEPVVGWASGKGQTFELPKSEFDRLEAAGAVASPKSAAAKAADSEPSE